MWFLVNSKTSIFGQDEFELISGLSFDLFPQHNETWLRIRDAYFNGENKVRNDHLEKVFISFGEVKNQKKKKNFLQMIITHFVFTIKVSIIFSQLCFIVLRDETKT